MGRVFNQSRLSGILCHEARKLIHRATLFMKIGYDLSNPRRTASCRNFQNLEFMHRVSICLLQFWKRRVPILAGIVSHTGAN
jgi:hypothetical protein